MIEDDQIKELIDIQQKMDREAFGMLLILAREWCKEFPRRKAPTLRLIRKSNG